MPQSRETLKNPKSPRSEQAEAPIRLMPRGFVVALREAKVDVEAILARAGLDAEALERRLTDAEARAFLRFAFEALDDPTFALNAGARVRPELFGVIGFAAMSCATYGEALGRFARYKHMLSADRMKVEAGPELTTVHLQLVDVDEPYGQQRVEGELALLVSFGRILTGHPIRPERLSVPFPRPSYHDRYDAIFGCPVTFDAERAALVFRNADMALPLCSRNPELALLFEEKAEVMLAATDTGPSLTDRVRLELRRLLRGDLPDVGIVARRLATSERSLQRKLQQEGTSFQQLVDDVRLELARRHLRDARIDAGEVAYLLGFTHPNSFYRAFKRWTGMTPDEYRRRAPLHS